MAGYDFTVSARKKWIPETTVLIRSFRRLGRRLGLKVHYRSVPSAKSPKKFHVTVDGPLLMMQVAEVEFWDLARAEVRVSQVKHGSRSAKSYLRSVVVPFLRANSIGVDEIARAIDELSVRLGPFGFVGPDGPIESDSMRQTINDEQDDPLILLLEAWRRARQRLFTATHPDELKESIILLDQRSEEFLRGSLPRMPRRVNYPGLTSAAVCNGLLSPEDKAILDGFHSLRNSVYHRRSSVCPEEYYRWITDLSKVLAGLCDRRLPE